MVIKTIFAIFYDNLLCKFVQRVSLFFTLLGIAVGNKKLGLLVIFIVS